jgi:hypothetical protein
MSNKLRKTRKGDRHPVVRKDELNMRLAQMEQKLEQLQAVLINTMYTARYASANLNNFISFLIEQKVFTEKDYNAFLEEIKRKSELAQEIVQDKSLTLEQKIAKAKENNIPEEWVKPPEEKAEETPSESSASESSASESSDSKIIVPETKIITP